MEIFVFIENEKKWLTYLKRIGSKFKGLMVDYYVRPSKYPCIVFSSIHETYVENFLVHSFLYANSKPLKKLLEFSVHS